MSGMTSAIKSLPNQTCKSSGMRFPYQTGHGLVANKVPLETLLLLAEANMTDERGQGDFVVQSLRKVDVST